MDGLKVKIDLSNIEEAYLKIRKSIRNKKKLYLFEKNYYANCNMLVDRFNNGYSYSKYNIFVIREKKKRLIMSSKLEDKIINHVVCKKILLPLDKYLVKIKNSSEEFYILKFDFSKYFFNISHIVLLNKLALYLNKEDLNIIKDILNTTNQIYINETIRKLGIDNIYINGVGLPIGNYTSQFLAVFYLNDLDHFIKEKLKCKYYIRYMDDGIIIDKSKERLREILTILSGIVKNDYYLEFNNKTKIYKSSEGFTFLGVNYKVRNKRIIRRVVSSTRRKIVKSNNLNYLQYEKK